MFERIGKLLCMSLSQDGCGYLFFSKCFFDFIYGKELNNIDVPLEAVHNGEACTLLREVSNKYVVCICDIVGSRGVVD